MADDENIRIEATPPPAETPEVKADPIPPKELDLGREMAKVVNQRLKPIRETAKAALDRGIANTEEIASLHEEVDALKRNRPLDLELILQGFSDEFDEE